MATTSSTFITLPHLEDYPLHISLFRDVSNAEFLREQLLKGNSDFEYAFLDATTIFSVNHVYAAVFRAVNDSIHGRLKSRNVHSEIVFSLSPNNNIAESFRRFGLQPNTRTLLAIKVIPKFLSESSLDSRPDGHGEVQGANELVRPNPSVVDPASHLASNVQGTQVPFSDSQLLSTCDLERIKKIYKLNEPAPSLLGNKKGAKAQAKPSNEAPPSQDSVSEGDEERLESERRDIEVTLLGIMALKGS